MFYTLTSISFSAFRWFLKGYSNPIDFTCKTESKSSSKVGKKIHSNISIKTPKTNLFYALVRTEPLKGSITSFHCVTMAKQLSKLHCSKINENINLC